MNNEFLQEGLNRTIKELFVFLKSRVKNEEFQSYVLLIDLTNSADYYIEKYISKGIQSDLKKLFRDRKYYNELKLKITEKDISLFKQEGIQFFQQVNIQQCYEELDKEDQTVLWKYFKNLFQIATMLSKTNITHSPPPPKL